MSSLHIKSDDDDDAGDRGMDAESPILIDEGKMSFSRDKKTGKKCFMIAARGLDIEWSNTPDYWEWLPHSDSRFGEVAKLKWVCWLDIRGKIETRRLSKRTKYVAYLVFKLEDKFHGLETVNAVVRFVDSMSVKEAEQRASVVHFAGQGSRETLPFKRADGWMELKMGDFFNDAGEDGDVDARLMETQRLEAKGGLIIQGVEFRPEGSRSGVSRSGVPPRMKKRRILLLLCLIVLVLFALIQVLLYMALLDERINREN